MARIRPMLDDFALENVQKVEIDQDRIFLQHEIPALEGDFFQGLGRRATSVSLTGVMTGTEAGENLETLRQKFRAAEPVPFVSDIMSATRIDRVMIQAMGISEVAGKPERFEYALTLREYIEATPVESENSPQEEAPLVSPTTAIDEDQGTLVVEVIAAGLPGFDFADVSLSAQSQDEDDNPTSRALTNRSDNIWTEETMPAGEHRIEARTTGNVASAGSVMAVVSAGQTTSVTLNLSRVIRTADVFVITFRFDSAFIEPCMRQVMREVAQHAVDHPDQKLLILGHTDRSGSAAYNQSLAERRARSAYAYLVFGRSRQEALAEWFALRQPRPPGTLPSHNDTWGAIEYQHMLQDLGFYPGPIDGNHGGLTDEAVEAFRCRVSLPPGTTMDDPTWEALIEAYLSQDALIIAEAQFFPNSSDGCDGGRVKWLGCGEEKPLPLPQPTKPSGWRPYRRVEFIFVNAPLIPCPVPQPVTFELAEPGAVASSWCLDPQGTASDRCCFATWDCAAATDESWCLQAVNATRIRVRGSIRNEDGSPHSQRPFVLIAPDGTFKAGESASGRPIPARTQSDGSFVFDGLPMGVYSVEVVGRHLVCLQAANDCRIEGNRVCKRLNNDNDHLDIIVIDAPMMRQISLPVAAHLMTALNPTSRAVRTCPTPSGPPALQATAHTDDEIRAAFASANSIWHQGRVRFELIDLVHETYALFPQCEVGENEFLTLLQNCAYRDVVNVFFLGDLAGQGEAGFGVSPEGGAALNVAGCAVGDRIQAAFLGLPTTVTLNAAATAQVLAHELGHYLNLSHAEADGRLMIATTDPFSSEDTSLIDAEVQTARTSQGARERCAPLVLRVTGATRIGGSLSDHFIAIQNPAETITLDAEIPDHLITPQQGTLILTGGNPGANNRQRLVATTTPGITEVTATYTPLNGRDPTSKTVTLRVVSFNLSVAGAVQGGSPPSGDFLAARDDDLIIRVSAVLDPAPLCLPSDLVVWQGGDQVVDPLAHTVSGAIQAQTVVSATLANITRSVSVSVFVLELEAVGAIPSAGDDATFLTVVDPDAQVTVLAQIDPQPSPVPTDLVNWSGGEEAPDALARLVSKASAGSVVVLAQVANISQQATINIATLSLSVQGATAFGPAASGNFVAIQTAGGNATVTALINPLPSPLPANFINWSGGNQVGGDPLQRTVSLANAGPQTISATVTGTTQSVTLSVVTFSLTVQNATVTTPGGNDFIAVADAGQNVTVQVQFNPTIASPPANLVTWVGGNAVVGNPLQRTLPKTAGISPIQVSATVAGSTQSVNITVISASLQVEDPIVQLNPLTSTRFFITPDPIELVTINLLTLPLLPDPLPPNFVIWTNGTQVAGNQQRRTLSRTTTGTTEVSATIAGTTLSVTITVFNLRMIDMSNTLIPLTGNDACLMVSKFITNVNLPTSATFTGPAGVNPDPDTFRIQLAGLPAGETPDIRLDVIRGATTRFSHDFDTIQGVITADVVYRTNEHIRLVSNAVDSAHLAHQTPRVRLGDLVRATLVINGQDIAFTAPGQIPGQFELQVGRPPNEDGPKAIRTVDINFMTLAGTNSNPAATIRRMSEDWAQLAIRFNLASQSTVTPVQNVLTIDLAGATTSVSGQLTVDVAPNAAGFINNLLLLNGTPNANGQLEVDITPAGGALVHVTLVIANGTPIQQVATNLAAAISAQPGLTATVHQSPSHFLILVNHGLAVAITNPNSTVATVILQIPPAGFVPAFTVVSPVAIGQTESQIAANLATAIAALPVIDNASSHRHLDLHLVMVNPGQNVGFNTTLSSLPLLVFTVPPLNFSDDILIIEGSVLALNFKDGAATSIDMIAIGNINIFGGSASPSAGLTGGDSAGTLLPAWVNFCVIVDLAVDTSDAGFPFVAGHEVGHTLLDLPNPMHTFNTNPNNLLIGGVLSTTDTITATKRLNNFQNTRARLVSGPGTVPPLLQKV